jgi:hypothetical protein
MTAVARTATLLPPKCWNAAENIKMVVLETVCVNHDKTCKGKQNYKIVEDDSNSNL